MREREDCHTCDGEGGYQWYGSEDERVECYECDGLCWRYVCEIGEVECPLCSGFGRVWVDHYTCPACDGEGVIYSIPEQEAKATASEG